MRDELFETDTSFVLNLKFSIPSLIYDPLGFFLDIASELLLFLEV